MKKIKTIQYVLAVALMSQFLVGCTAWLKNTLKNNPDILAEAVKEHPKEFISALEVAAQEYRKASMADKQKEAKGERLKEIKNPKKANIAGRAFKGSKNGDIVIVKFSDFQCPYCSKGAFVVSALMKKYPGRVKYVFKHLPLDFHPHAKKAAIYFEAIAQQSFEKAFAFHDYIFKNQSQFKSEAFLKKALKSIKGVNVARVNKALNSSEIKERVEADIAEAQKFGFRGTPGFLVNGVSLRGAMPIQEFEKVIKEVKQERG